MKPIATSLMHRVILPEHPPANKHPAILMLHGRGADEEDLVGVASMLDERFMIISARAPFPFSAGGYTWYDLEEIGSPDLAMFNESYEKLSVFLGDVLAGYPVDPARILLFGFSMGTVMSYALALSQPERIRAVAANSGYLPEVPAMPYRWQDMANTEFFITHGTVDPVIPVAMARRARDLMARSNAVVSYREYPAPHALCEDALADVIAWTHRFIS